MSIRVDLSFPRNTIYRNEDIRTDSNFMDIEEIPDSPSVQNINPEILLDIKLKNSDFQLTTDESIDLLTHCILLGEQEAENAKEQELIVVIGNAGSGKSTLVNYLYGCKMKRVKPQDLGITGLEKVVVVDNTSEDTSKEIMQIGHTRKSNTFMPQIATDQNGFTFCDCPGFFDNRGMEINIAHAVNTKKTFFEAKNIKIIMLISYHSLVADKAQGLSDMIKSSCGLFGSKENLIKNKDSILLGITKVPLMESQDQEPLENLKDFIADAKLGDLTERLFIYDPLDIPFLKYSGMLKKDEILEKIESMDAIEDPSNIFKTVLTPKNEIDLIKICDTMKDKITQVFAKEDLSKQDFKKVARYLEILNKLDIIDHSTVTNLLDNAKDTVVKEFKKMMYEFEKSYINALTDFSQESNEVLKKLKAGIQYFDDQIQDNVNLTDLEERYNLCMKKLEAKEKINQMLDKEKKFRDYCLITNFRAAKNLLSELKILEENFNKDYHNIDVENPIDIDELNEVYKKSKKQVENQKKLNLKNSRTIKKLEKQEAELEKKVKETEKKQLENQTKLESKYKSTIEDYKNQGTKLEKKLEEVEKKLEKEKKKRKLNSLPQTDIPIPIITCPPIISRKHQFNFPGVFGESIKSLPQKELDKIFGIFNS
jgi:energy-coupling factor transporter ATP-binding protein EcfA2